MKNTSWFSILILLLLLTPACDKFHDNIQPTDNLPVSAAYKSAADLEAALNGAYNSLQGISDPGVALLLISELMCGEGSFKLPGFPDVLDLSNLSLRSSNYHATIFWTDAYKTINLVNQILRALETIQDPALTPDLRARIEGEALFIRGYLYFELVRYFGKVYSDTSAEGGVPIVTEPVTQKGDLTFPFRASVQQGYDRAIADLSRAMVLLPPGQPYDKASAPAAKALLAKIAFQTEDYTEAASLAKDLMDNYGFTLTANPEDFFRNKNSTEAIWSIGFSAADPGSKYDWFGESSKLVEISDGLKTAFAAIASPAQKAAVANAGLFITDLRSKAGNLVSADTLYTNKYADPGGADDTPIVRLAEIILMRAEALARADELQPALDLLNMIRSRSLRVVDANGDDQPDQRHFVLYSLTDFTNGKEDLIDAIVLERRVELCFEGSCLQDMIRLKRDVQGLSYDECRLRLPIPQRERDVNQNLSQHKCYE